MKKLLTHSLILLIAAPILASCSSGSVRDKMGMRRSAPNEFKVVSNPPLSVPPTFSLRPPVAVDAFVEQKSTTDEARQVLFEKASADIKIPNKSTNGEDAFSSLFGATDANPEIKSILQKEFLEAAKKEEEKSLLEKLSAFSITDDGEEADPIVDAKLEKDRIIKSKKSGEAITGSETATAESGSKKSGFFNKVFGL